METHTDISKNILHTHTLRIFLWTKKQTHIVNSLECGQDIIALNLDWFVISNGNHPERISPLSAGQ